jgi:hypothetical protein
MKLLLGEYNIPVSTQDIEEVSLNFKISDVKNYGKKNASSSKPISVLKTKETEEIFKSIFNISVTGTFDSSKKIRAEIKDDGGLTILVGVLKLLEVKPDNYECVVISNNISLVSILGNKLFTGNTDPSDNLYFDPSLYYHVCEPSTLKYWLNNTFTPDGSGYFYPIIDYIGNVNNITDIDFNTLSLPAVAAYEIFDKILIDNNFTYELSDEIDFYLRKMYIPLNDNLKNLISPWDCVKFRIGNPADLKEPKDVEVDGATRYWSTNATRPCNIDWYDCGIHGHTYDLNGDFYDNFDYDSSVYSTYYDSSIINSFKWSFWPSDGVYDISIFIMSGTWNNYDHQWYNYQSHGHLPDTGGLTSYWLTVLTPKNECFDYKITDSSVLPGIVVGDATFFPDASARYHECALEKIEIPKNSRVMFRAFAGADAAFYYDASTMTFVDLDGAIVWPDLLPRYDPSTCIKFVKTDTVFGKEFNMNNMLPKSYKQADFIKDILTTFNIYVETDVFNEKHLIFKSRNEYFVGGNTWDWSDKMVYNDDSPKYHLLKNDIAKKFKYTSKEDKDVYNSNYIDTHSYPLYNKVVNNDSEFVTDESEIKLNTGSTPIKSVKKYIAIGGTYPNIYGIYSDVSAYRIPALINDKDAKTDWAPRMLFPNTKDISIGFGGYTRPYTKLNTLVPYYSESVYDASNLFLGWDSKDTYIVSHALESNVNIYNKYYKDELERMLNNDSYILEAEFQLTNNDINKFRFNDKIWIKSSVIGNGLYRVNEIKNFKESRPTKVELIKIIPLDTDYNLTIPTSLLYLSSDTEYASVNTDGIKTNNPVNDPSGGTSTTIVNNEYINNYFTNVINGSTNCDASIVRIDGSINVLFVHDITLDASISFIKSNYVPCASLGDDFYWDTGLLEVSVASSSSSVNVANGLQVLSDGSIGLGGDLIQDTSIGVLGFDFQIISSSEFSPGCRRSNSFRIDPSGNITLSATETLVHLSSAGSFSISGDGKNIDFVAQNGYFKIGDVSTLFGWRAAFYDADYSTTFDSESRSIPDCAWVFNKIDACIFSIGFSGTFTADGSTVTVTNGLITSVV